jgi:hypothetical protein
MRTRLIARLLALVFCFAAGSVSYASHFQGGGITYTCVAPRTYLVNYKVFTECGGAGAPTTEMLALTAPGCNSGRTVILNPTGVTKVGDPYCSAIGNLCTSSRSNQIETNYAVTVTFSAQEAACPNWTLSVTQSARAAVANLVNPQGDFYVEAYLNLAAGIENNSAVINPTGPTVEIVCGGQETRLSLHAYDSDCDSLSYELVAPLSAAGVAYSYVPIMQPSSNFFPNPNPTAPYCNSCTPPNPQLGNLVSMPASFSATYPLPSISANWSAINPVTGIPYQVVTAYSAFNLNQATGELAFQAPAAVPSTPALAQNRYQVAVKITEWRKRNGVMTMVGNIRRDMVFIVENCGTNLNPSVLGLTANGQSIQAGQVLTLNAGTTLNLQFATTDQQGDVLTLVTDATTILPGATFTQSTAAQPSGQISWVVPSTNGFCGVRYFYIKVKDDSCPIRGKKVYVIGVRVLNSGTVMGMKDEQKNSLKFIAYPNPFTESVSFRFNGEDLAGNQAIEIYNGLGQQIDRISLEEGKQTIEWQNAPKFPAGNYIARLLTGGKPAQTLKFMKLQ